MAGTKAHTGDDGGVVQGRGRRVGGVKNEVGRVGRPEPAYGGRGVSESGGLLTSIRARPSSTGS
jgi:hypothetical protein